MTGARPFYSWVSPPNADAEVQAIKTRSDWGSHRLALSAHRRTLIRDFFEPHVADALYRALVAQDWSLVYRENRADQKVRGAELRQMGVVGRADLSQRIVKEAERDFQFAFLSHDMAQAEESGQTDLLTRFLRWMNSEEFFQPMRELTGISAINRLYAQGTGYGPGHFLMVHDDEVPVENRRAAYVINLTQSWRPDWGALLHFCDPSGNVVDTFYPHFNSLSIFLVPQDHFVSYVPPYAKGERYAITGWLIESS